MFCNYPSFFNNVKFIKLIGYHGNNKNRDKAKIPAKGECWKDDLTKRYTFEQVCAYQKQDNYGIGLLIPENFIVLDLDTPEAVKYVIQNNDKFTVLQETRKGYHAFFTCPAGKSFTPATHTLANGIEATIRAAGKNYVCTCMDGYSWAKCGELTELPSELWPVESAKKVNNNNRKEKVNKISAPNINQLRTYHENNQSEEISEATFALCRNIARAKDGKRHQVRRNSILQFFSFLKAGDLKLNEFWMIVAACRKNTSNAGKTESDIWNLYAYAEQNARVEHYKSQRQNEINRSNGIRTAIEAITETNFIKKYYLNSELSELGINTKVLGEAKRKKIAGKTVRVHTFNIKTLTLKKIAKKTTQENLQYAHTQSEESDETDILAGIMVANMARLTEAMNVNKPPEPVPEEKELSLCDYVRKMFGLQEA